MKKITTLMSAVALATGVAANIAHASDGSINFQGAVIASTCKISNVAADGNLAVMLPDVGTGQLSAAGMSAGRTPFSFQLTGCSTSADAPTLVGVSFEAGPSVNLATGRLKPIDMPNPASNVELALLNDKYQPIKVGADYTEQNSQAVSIVDGGATLQYAVEYVATGVATAGDASSYVTYSLVYP
ncbi:fimbrial protein [Burkholderia cenocepacia]|jgi:major type 1 subunit fimbrin (pilin)|uniref:fimbrial protein n=1 Tax=Burkholderia cenocepacia TaxID=95486 RepID=UPI00042E98DA|nr:fimbrial protein [Burkholderia cenocepacia]AIO44528.1 fimbrial family protein [Burkholderia cepacia]KGC01678.1 fimbrial family protein [Burkholderia cepacia]MCG0581875.1 type 1 fimbrial protein [Burkholderia cenocepacia]MCW3522707.1 type 1 fimbrial protein [Burkholderia cenocepacia]MCW3613149.1 type 1 fimbrial protein [Burkholderia cenocepacia]